MRKTSHAKLSIDTSSRICRFEKSVDSNETLRRRWLMLPPYGAGPRHSLMAWAGYEKVVQRILAAR